MLDWLLAPIDVTRGHDLSAAVAWHGRLMVLAWAVLLPAGVIIARYYKVTRRQNWPTELDNKLWWYAHLTLQVAGGACLGLGLYLIWRPWSLSSPLHTWLGWSLVLAYSVQFFGGWLRGSKGGPTDPGPDGSLAGDHYDMSARRRAFEAIHKSLGYAALLGAVGGVLSGLWLVNAPRWMWVTLALWWLLLALVGRHLESHSRGITTYQAIWGPDPKHPGNAASPTDMTTSTTTDNS
jgi:Eukaryotic cytochrome b561